MKSHILSFLLTGLICFNFNNQINGQNKLRPIKLHYENTGGEKGISYYEYDGNNRMIKGRWELLDGSRWSVNYYLYDEKGQQVEKYREFSDDLITSLKYIYNEEGKLIAEKFWGSDGRDGTTTFSYNKNGHLSGADCHEYYGWIDGKMTFVCDENGRKKTAQLLKDDKLYANVTFDYDEYGNLIKEFWNFTVNWSQTFIYEFEGIKPSYTSSNVFITENSRFHLVKEKYSYNDETGGPSLFEYDGKGKLIEKTFIRSDSLKTKTSYEYDESGLLTKSIRKFSDSRVGTFTYEFTPNRKIAKRHYKTSDGTIGEEEYFYDDKGKLVSGKLTNFDGWLTGDLTFEYGRSDLILSAKFIGKNGFNADLTFKYDENGNLWNIHWDLSFGKTQVYWFEYSRLY